MNAQLKIYLTSLGLGPWIRIGEITLTSLGLGPWITLQGR
jgi:hypothetical protein